MLFLLRIQYLALQIAHLAIASHLLHFSLPKSKDGEVFHHAHVSTSLSIQFGHHTGLHALATRRKSQSGDLFREIFELLDQASLFSEFPLGQVVGAMGTVSRLTLATGGGVHAFDLDPFQFQLLL